MGKLQQESDIIWVLLDNNSTLRDRVTVQTFLLKYKSDAYIFKFPLYVT